MLLKKTFLFLLLAVNFALWSQKYAINKINDSLLEHANAVIRLDQTNIKLINPSKMLIHKKQAISVLNQQADDLARLSLFYDKENKIKNVHISYYNKYGLLIKSFLKKDFKDYSASGASLYTDNRVLTHYYSPEDYPYTVVFEYELLNKYTAFIPTWQPIQDYNTSIELSSYNFSYPQNIKILKSEKNFATFPIEKMEKPGFIKYQIYNIKPIKREALSLGLDKYVPYARLASNKFYLAGVYGNVNNWTDWGIWMHNKLLASRNNLPKETKEKVRTLVAGISDPTEKAKKIYEYVQNKTRYIYVGIGIGGWQPMKTADVDKLGYGDCKALTFYTKSLLDAVGVTSIYSMVFAGEHKKNIDKNVACMQGDHAILCLPREKDSIWLECTSQKDPFGFINSFTDDRNVILITPQGAKIVHTSTNKPEDNLMQTTADYTLDANGDINGNIKIKSFGTQYSHHLSRFDGLKYKKLEERFLYYFSHINNLKVSNIKVKNNKEKKDYEESLNISAAKYTATNNDGSIFFTPNAFSRNTYVPDKERDRKTPFYISRGFKDIDEYDIHIDACYIIGALPEAKHLKNEFGSYDLSITKKDAHTLHYKRVFVLKNGQFPKEQYKKYRKYRKKIKKLELLKLLLSKS